MVVGAARGNSALGYGQALQQGFNVVQWPAHGLGQLQRGFPNPLVQVRHQFSFRFGERVLDKRHEFVAHRRAEQQRAGQLPGDLAVRQRDPWIIAERLLPNRARTRHAWADNVLLYFDDSPCYEV